VARGAMVPRCVRVLVCVELLLPRHV
jgi:hypothetical protein